MNLQRVFDSVAQKLAIDFESVSSQIEHRPSKGRIREVEIVEQFLRPYLPQRIGIGHGEIIATDDSVSSEADIVFFESQKCPTLIQKTGYQVFPVESVYGLVEVKSRLDNRELEDAFHKINRLKGFPKTAFISQAGAILNYTKLYDREWEFFPSIGFLFAYDSIDLTTLCSKLEELNASAPIHQRIDFVTVLKKGAIMNWSDEWKLLIHSPTTDSRLRVIESSNPLFLTIIFLQQLLQSAWMPQFDIKRYLSNVEYGKFLGT